MAFTSHPPPDQWDDYVDFESTSWPKKDRRHYWIIPTICFNCESACGLLAYVDKQSMNVRKVEGNPMHPGSRGRTCAKGVVTPNQLEDPDRILYPLRRKGRAAPASGSACRGTKRSPRSADGSARRSRKDAATS
jgi:anaerobic selenocysteine-containing dehydrogenase